MNSQNHRPRAPSPTALRALCAALRALCVTKHNPAATICALLCFLLFAGCASNPAKKLSNTTFTRMEFVQGRTQLYTTSDKNTMRGISELLARQNWSSYLPTTEPANWQDQAFIHLFAGNNEVGTVSFYVNTPRSHFVLTFSIRSHHATLSETDTALVKQWFIRFPNSNLYQLSNPLSPFTSPRNPATTHDNLVQATMSRALASPEDAFKENIAAGKVEFYAHGSRTYGWYVTGLTADEAQRYAASGKIPVVIYFLDDPAPIGTSEAYWNAVDSFLTRYNRLVMQYVYEREAETGKSPNGTIQALQQNTEPQ